jgi:CP family cyanate transporter-like MFS transporter
MSSTLEELEPPVGTARPRGAHGTARGRLAAAVLTTGLLLISLNLRIGVASVGPVLTNIRHDLGLSATAVSLLTTIPVVAFGAFAFLTPWLTRRLGMHRLLGMTMAALAAGIALRLQPSLAGLFAGTIIAGAAIAIANVVMPAIIKHHLSHRAGLMMGLYSTSLFLGAALGDGLTVPLLPVAGGHWRPALALWSIPAVAAFLIWIPQLFRSPDHAGRAHGVPDAPSAQGEPSFLAILTDPVAIAVTALMGIQSTGYYATLTWLPTLLQDHGMTPHSAGWMLSYSAFPGIAAALVSPALARRIRPTWVPIALSAAVDGAAYAGLVIAPVHAAYLWMTLLGLGQGASISLSLSYIAWRSPDASHTAHVSTMAQGFGYLLASLGPIGIGAIHAASGNWTVPLIVLAVLLVLQVIAGTSASRERHVLGRPRHTASPDRWAAAFGRRPAGRHAQRTARLMPAARYGVSLGARSSRASAAAVGARLRSNRDWGPMADLLVRRCGLVSARHTVVAGRVLVRDGVLTVPGVEETLRGHAAAAARIQGLSA